MDTKIICVFPYYWETFSTTINNINNLKILYINVDDYYWEYKKISKDILKLNKKNTIKKLNFIDKLSYNYRHKYDVIAQKNKNFPNNYINEVKKNIGKYDYIVLNPDMGTRKHLQNNNIRYTVVFPRYSLKEEALGKAFLNGLNYESLKNISSNWDNCIIDCMLDKETLKGNCTILKSGQNLSDVLSNLICIL